MLSETVKCNTGLYKPTARNKPVKAASTRKNICFNFLALKEQVQIPITNGCVYSLTFPKPLWKKQDIFIAVNAADLEDEEVIPNSTADALLKVAKEILGDDAPLECQQAPFPSAATLRLFSLPF